MVDVLLVAADRMAALLDDLERSDTVDVSDVLADWTVCWPARHRATHSNQIADIGESQHRTLTVEPASQVFQRFPIAIDLSACQAAGISPQEVVERANQWGEISDGSIESPYVDLAQSPPVGPVIWRATIASQFDADEFGRRMNVPLQSVDQDKQLPAAAAAVADDQSACNRSTGHDSCDRWNSGS